MDYSRIYREFIAHRLTKQPTKPTYFERHHIVPSACGGSDDESNLIRLTPEDHFFAHLLLAKIHGGVLWAPIAFMVGGSRKDYKPTVSRVRHGWASRAMAKVRSGENASHFDRSEYSLVHKTGLKWNGLQSAMTELGLSKPMANLLIKGRVFSAKGWQIEGSGHLQWPRNGRQHSMYKPEIFELYHVDGRRASGDRLDLQSLTGLARPKITQLLNGHSVVSAGWHLPGAVLPTLGRGAKWRQLSK